jgi:MFS transporter, FSR family, fosmidomycin resistance protein
MVLVAQKDAAAYQRVLDEAFPLRQRDAARASALVAAPIFAAFLLVDALPVKVGLVGVLGLVTAGWYSIPKARLYAALPGRSGTAVAFGSVFGAARGAVPIVLGAVAARYGLDTALWLLLIAPVSLLVLAGR